MGAIGLFCFDFVGGWLIWPIARARLGDRKQSLPASVARRVALLFIGVLALASASGAFTRDLAPTAYLFGLLTGCLSRETMVLWLTARARARSD